VTNADLRSLLAGRLKTVEERIESACRRTGRVRADVTLVAVTKNRSIEAAAVLSELGVRDLGENRPQELWRKAEAITKVRWHLIGHLQRNKVERTLPLVYRIHSVDSLRLLEALEMEAARSGRQIDVLLEVNVSREASKQGFDPENLEVILPRLETVERVRVKGLMTMAAVEEDAERCRPTFAGLRILSERLRNRMPPPHCLTELSMGMSNDFEIAIEEGATMVRIGSALFED
jgi:pyridoxal phosphate enzyme (YggS family)